MIIEIMFTDLTESKQKEILQAYNIESAEDMNLDIAPLMIIEI